MIPPHSVNRRGGNGERAQQTPAYRQLPATGKIVNYKDSPACKEKQQCSLGMAKIPLARSINKNQVFPGRESRQLAGRCVYFAILRRFSEDQVAWGEIKSDQQWKVLSKLKTATRTACLPHRKWRAMLRTAGQLYRQSSGHRSHQRTENTVLVGHDSNIASLLTALDFNRISCMTRTNARRLAAKSFSALA